MPTTETINVLPENKVVTTGIPMTRVNTMHGESFVIAAGVLTKQPCSKPYRIVLVKTDSKLIVWNQVFHDETMESFDEYSFCYGHYFDHSQLADAFKRFAEKCMDNAPSVGTIYSGR